jgi:hypothetical protein
MNKIWENNFIDYIFYRTTPKEQSLCRELLKSKILGNILPEKSTPLGQLLTDNLLEINSLRTIPKEQNLRNNLTDDRLLEDNYQKKRW